MTRSLPRSFAAIVGLVALLIDVAEARAAGAQMHRAQTGPPIDVALVLAVDISLSMDQGEQLLQRTGYVEAFRHPELIATIEQGLFQRISVTYFEWGSASEQRLILPWTIVEDEASAESVAMLLESTPISRSRSTSISAALAFARRLMLDLESEPVRRVIDISGDGPNNDGRPVLDARADVLAEGITINGLPLLLRPMGFSPWSIPELDLYYADCVIGGPGAFILPVRDPADIKDAIRQKLLLEIAGLPAAPQRALLQPAKADATATDCLIGEKLRRQMWQD
jgi:hypothetical protein